jgi:hypothetical protein
MRVWKDADEFDDKNIAEMKLFVYTKNIYGVSMEDRIEKTSIKNMSHLLQPMKSIVETSVSRPAAVNNLTENKRIYTKKMDALMTRQDYNLDMYKNSCQRITSFLSLLRRCCTLCWLDVECRKCNKSTCRQGRVPCCGSAAELHRATETVW